MEETYYITRRTRYSQEDGPEITAEEWADHVALDGELRRDGVEDDPNGAVSWKTHANVFRLERGNVVGVSSDLEVLTKMLAMAVQLDARVMGHDGVVYVKAPSPTSIRRTRRVIPRAAAALVLSVVGLSLLSAAMLHLIMSHNYNDLSLRGASFSFVLPPLIGVGTVAIIASVILAVSSLYPWDRRWSKFAILALILDGLPVLFV